MTSKRRDMENQPGFLGWLRGNVRLDSITTGVVATDCDLWIHKYKTIDTRDFQFLMLLEIKEHGRAIDKWQRDTLHVANQLLRNRRNKNKHQVNDGPRICQVHSVLSGKAVNVCCFGVHSLTIHGDGADTSTRRLTWDSVKDINVDQLERLLLFELDPDDLCELDHRPRGNGGRHKTTEIVKHIEYPIGFTVEKPIIFKS